MRSMLSTVRARSRHRAHDAFHPSGIRGQLALLEVAVVLPMAARSAIQVAEDARKARARLAMVALSVAESNAADIGEAVGSIRGFLAELARRPSVRNLDPAHCDPILGQAFHKLFPQYSNQLTKNLEGRALCSSRPMAPGAATGPS